MKIQQRGLVLRLLCLLVLVAAAAVLGTGTKSEACQKCVTLDPGSAINKGCMWVTEGVIMCTPVHGDGCLISQDWCRVRPPTTGGGSFSP